MNSKIELLIQAVNDLKGSSSIAKDYIYPIVIPFLSAFVGVAAAKLTFRHQERVRAEINKVNALNKLIIQVGEARSALLAIKHNYKNLSETNFIERALRIPPIIITDYKLESNASELTFLVDVDTDYDAAEYDKTWINIARVGMLISNYHQVFTMLSKRNELCLDIMESIASLKERNNVTTWHSVEFKSLIEVVGKTKLISFCDLTQSFISFLDDVLTEANDFMCNFPGQAREKIDLKLIKGYCSVLSYQVNDYLMKRTIDPDYQFIADAMGVTIDEAKGRYDFGFKRS